MTHNAEQKSSGPLGTMYDELRKLCGWRGAGRWRQYDYHSVVVDDKEGNGSMHTGASFHDDTDARLTVLAVNAAPALLKALERVEQICQGSEDAYPDIPQEARTALRVHIKNTRLVIKDALEAAP